MKTHDSPAMQLIEFVCEHKMEKCPWSRERSDRITQEVWQLAVRGGFRFENGDFGEPGTYIDEGLYAAAILEGNTSAITAMEYTAKRKPFIARNVTPLDTGRRMAHMAGPRDECRLAAGFSFVWDGRRVKVTSFAKDSSYIVACAYPNGSYHNVPICDTCGQKRYDEYDSKANRPERVYKITVDELRAGRAEHRKKHPKCKLCLLPTQEGREICDDAHTCCECHAEVKTAKDGKRTTLSGRYSQGYVVCNTCVKKYAGE